jgi:hypothetical protein
MPGYISKALRQFWHEQPQRLQNSPHPHVAPTCGGKAQFVEMETPSIPLDKKGQKFIQAVTGTLLYHSQAVDPTMLVALMQLLHSKALLRRRHWTDSNNY